MTTAEATQRWEAAKAAVKAAQAEVEAAEMALLVARLRAESPPAVVINCRECNEPSYASALDVNQTCSACNAAYDGDEDPNAEHASAYYRDVAGGCR